MPVKHLVFSFLLATLLFFSTFSIFKRYLLQVRVIPELLKEKKIGIPPPFSALDHCYCVCNSDLSPPPLYFLLSVFKRRSRKKLCVSSTNFLCCLFAHMCLGHLTTFVLRESRVTPRASRKSWFWLSTLTGKKCSACWQCLPATLLDCP